jgi:hypothetical protein
MSSITTQVCFIDEYVTSIIQYGLYFFCFYLIQAIEAREKAAQRLKGLLATSDDLARLPSLKEDNEVEKTVRWFVGYLIYMNSGIYSGVF